MRPEILDGELGGSQLARAAIAGDHPAAADWYQTRPATPAEWTARAREVRLRFSGNDWLSRLSGAIDASGPAAERLERVASAGGVLITTGQQPGLFGGPIYTWVKALSALAFADELEHATGIPAAPLFWAATDDADYAEASGTWVSTREGARQLSLPDTDTRGRTMAELKLPPHIGRLAGELRMACGSIADPAPLAAVEGAWREGVTIGDAYLRMLRELLQPLGIPVIDASHRSLRMEMEPLMRRALERAGEIGEALDARDQELSAAGFRPQVALVKDLSLVFENHATGKDRVPIQSAAKRARIAKPGSLGPNVLLRPVAEQALLPTVAYAAGPGEIAYFAQVSAVAEVLGEPVPLALPRYSVTLVEPHVRGTLQALGLEPDDLLDPHAPERRLAREAVSTELAAALEELREAVRERMLRLGRIAAGTTPDGNGVPPEAVFQGAWRQLEHRLDRLERRVAAAAARGDGRTGAALAMVRGSLVPGGTRQERALNIVPLLARYGSALLGDIREAARPHARRCMGLQGPHARDERTVATGSVAGEIA